MNTHTKVFMYDSIFQQICNQYIGQIGVEKTFEFGFLNHFYFNIPVMEQFRKIICLPPQPRVEIEHLTRSELPVFDLGKQQQRLVEPGHPLQVLDGICQLLRIVTRRLLKQKLELIDGYRQWGLQLMRCVFYELLLLLENRDIGFEQFGNGLIHVLKFPDLRMWRIERFVYT